MPLMIERGALPLRDGQLAQVSWANITELTALNLHDCYVALIFNKKGALACKIAPEQQEQTARDLISAYRNPENQRLYLGNEPVALQVVYDSVFADRGDRIVNTMTTAGFPTAERVSYYNPTKDERFAYRLRCENGRLQHCCGPISY